MTHLLEKILMIISANKMPNGQIRNKINSFQHKF